MKFQILQYSNGQYYWRLVAANGRIIATSGESYVRKTDWDVSRVLWKKENGVTSC